MSIKTGNVLHRGLVWGACCVMTLLPMATVMAQSGHGAATSTKPSPQSNPFLQNAAQAAATTMPTTGIGTPATPSPANANGTPTTNTRTQQVRNSSRHNVGSGGLVPPMSH